MSVLTGMVLKKLGHPTSGVRVPWSGCCTRGFVVPSCGRNEVQRDFEDCVPWFRCLICDMSMCFLMSILCVGPVSTKDGWAARPRPEPVETQVRT